MENSQFNPMGIIYFLISIFCSVSCFGLVFVWSEEICSQLSEKFLYKIESGDEIKMNINSDFLKIFSLLLFSFNICIMFLVPKNEIFFDSSSNLFALFSVYMTFFIYFILSGFKIGVNKCAMFLIGSITFLLCLLTFALSAGIPQMITKVLRMFYI